MIHGLGERWSAEVGAFPLHIASAIIQNTLNVRVIGENTIIHTQEASQWDQFSPQVVFQVVVLQQIKLYVLPWPQPCFVKPNPFPSSCFHKLGPSCNTIWTSSCPLGARHLPPYHSGYARLFFRSFTVFTVLQFLQFYSFYSFIVNLSDIVHSHFFLQVFSSRDRISSYKALWDKINYQHN